MSTRERNNSKAPFARGTAATFWAAAFALLLACAPIAAAQQCGDATGDEEVTAADALVVLRVAVDLDECEPCVCDVDDSDEVVTADALAILTAAVGGSVELDCPACVTTTTTVEDLRVQCGDPNAEAPACDGYCGVDGQMCVESPPHSGNCQCIFGSTCGAAAGPPVCAGACDALFVCRDIGGTCRCVF